MPVTDDQVATLRAHLAEDRDEYQRLSGELDRETARTGYPALVTRAFFEAVRRRFAPTTPRSEIIEYVGKFRAQFDPNGDRIDPDVAEQLVLEILGHDTHVDAFSPEITAYCKILLVTALVHEANYDDAQLDEFMAKARANADYMLKKREERKR